MATLSTPPVEVVVLSAWQEKQQKRGSPINDWFRWWHKKLGRGWYGADLDLVIHGRTPPGIAAVLDFKGPDEQGLGFSHAQVYNSLAKRWRIYIVELQNPVVWRDVLVGHNGEAWRQRIAAISDEEHPQFLVSRFVGGDWRPDPPLVGHAGTIKLAGIEDWRRWERGVRERWEQSPAGCREGEHLWEAADMGTAPWGEEVIMACGACGLWRYRDRYCEGPVEAPLFKYQQRELF